MRKGRDIIIYSLAYIAGDVIWQSTAGCLGIPAIVFLALLLAVAAAGCISILCMDESGKVPSAFLIACFCLLGASGAIAGGLPAEGMTIFLKAAELKASFSGLIDSILPAGHTDETAIAKALAIGDKSMIDTALRNRFKASGAMHLLALSGLHVGVVYTFLTAATSPLGNSPAARHVRRAVILAALWAFALISGLSSSICRAVTMITVYEICKMTGSDRNMLRALAISALLICLFNPDAPFEIGFQLSYSAVCGIYFLFPRIKALLDSRSRILSHVWNTISLSISCQAATAPLALIYFGTFPKYFMVTNLLAIPLCSAAMWMLPITAAARNIPFIGVPGGRILLGILQTLDKVVGIIASL